MRLRTGPPLLTYLLNFETMCQLFLRLGLEQLVPIGGASLDADHFA